MNKRKIKVSLMLLFTTLLITIAFSINSFANNNEVESITEELINSFTQDGGVVLAVPSFDLTNDNAVWNMRSDVSANFVSGEDYGYYSLVPSREQVSAGFWQSTAITLKPNRNYKVSALVNTNFDRYNFVFDISNGNLKL